jgi:MoxR-like ATPase
MNSEFDERDPWPGWGPFRGLAGSGTKDTRAVALPAPPPWRRFPQGSGTEFKSVISDDRGATYRAARHTIEMVNAALYLRRPLLVTGKPGAGKSTLVYAVARELELGPVLRWNITSRTSLKDGLYQYDALGRLHDYNMKKSRPIGDYIDLGPLATAMLPNVRPRALLIDEIDKADIDLPNDLLNIFEEGYFEIPELAREEKSRPIAGKNKIRRKVARVSSADDAIVGVQAGRIYCTNFPFVLLTSNGEREFPPPFLRRCLRLYLPSPDEKLLARIVDAHLPIDSNDPKSELWREQRTQMITNFVERAKRGELATDQLLNAIFMTTGHGAALASGEAAEHVDENGRRRLVDAILRHLTSDTILDDPSEADQIGGNSEK